MLSSHVAHPEHASPEVCTRYQQPQGSATEAVFSTSELASRTWKHRRGLRFELLARAALATLRRTVRMHRPGLSWPWESPRDFQRCGYEDDVRDTGKATWTEQSLNQLGHRRRV
jgi:hypothetical protein